MEMYQFINYQVEKKYISLFFKKVPGMEIFPFILPALFVVLINVGLDFCCQEKCH